jgi:hypothetical protein
MEWAVKNNKPLVALSQTRQEVFPTLAAEAEW